MQSSSNPETQYLLQILFGSGWLLSSLSPYHVYAHARAQNHAVPTEQTWCWNMGPWVDAVGNERGLEGDFGLVWSPFDRWQNEIKRYGYFCKIKCIKYLLKTGHLQASWQSFGGGRAKVNKSWYLPSRRMWSSRREESYHIYYIYNIMLSYIMLLLHIVSI